MPNRLPAPALRASLGALASCASPGVGGGLSRAADSAGARAVAQGLRAALDSLQLDAFRGDRAEDVTMFLPFAAGAEPPTRETDAR